MFQDSGHTYLGEYSTAGSLFGTWAGSLGGFLFSPEVRNTSLVQNTTFYSVYAAYRDARNYNGQHNYAYPMPTDSLAELSYAPFNPKIMKKPEVWGGVLGGLTLGAAVSYLAFNDLVEVQQASAGSRAAKVFSAFPVGIGEEAFFRGYVRSSLMEPLTPWGAIGASSVVFGLAHAGKSAIEGNGR